MPEQIPPVAGWGAGSGGAPSGYSLDIRRYQNMFGATDWGAAIRDMVAARRPQTPEEYQNLLETVQSNAASQGADPARIAELQTMTANMLPEWKQHTADKAQAQQAEQQRLIMEEAGRRGQQYEGIGGKYEGKFGNLANAAGGMESVGMLGNEARTGALGHAIAENRFNSAADTAYNQAQSMAAGATGASGLAMAYNAAQNARANAIQGTARDAANSELQSRLQAMGQYNQAQENQLGLQGGFTDKAYGAVTGGMQSADTVNRDARDYISGLSSAAQQQSANAGQAAGSAAATNTGTATQAGIGVGQAVGQGTGAAAAGLTDYLKSQNNPGKK